MVLLCSSRITCGRKQPFPLRRWKYCPEHRLVGTLEHRAVGRLSGRTPTRCLAHGDAVPIEPDRESVAASSGGSSEPWSSVLMVAVLGADHFDGGVHDGFEFRFLVEAMASLEYFVA